MGIRNINEWLVNIDHMTKEHLAILSFNIVYGKIGKVGIVIKILRVRLKSFEYLF